MELLFYDEMEETVGYYLAAAHGFFVRFVVGLAIYAESHFLGCFAEQFFFRDAQPFHEGPAGSADAVGTVFPDDFFPAVLEKGLPERLGRIGCVRGKGFGCDAVAAEHFKEDGTQLFLVVNGWFGNEKEDVPAGGFGQDHADDHEPVEIAVGAEDAERFGNYGALRGSRLSIELFRIHEMKEPFPVFGMDEVFCKVVERAVNVRIRFTYLLVRSQGFDDFQYLVLHQVKLKNQALGPNQVLYLIHHILYLSLLLLTLLYYLIFLCLPAHSILDNILHNDIFFLYFHSHLEVY